MCVFLLILCINFYFSHTRRQFSHIRFAFLLIVVLNTLATKDNLSEPIITYRKYFADDLKFCYNCFETQIGNCNTFFDHIRTDADFSIRQLLNLLPELPCKRNYHWISIKGSNKKLIIKYLFKRKIPSESNSKEDQLKKQFLQQQENLEGMQYAPVKTIDIFVKNLQNLHGNLSKMAIWNYMLNNVQALILPILYERNFPVPKTYAVCGFALYQQYAGKDLNNFFDKDFLTKLEISKQLLEAAIKFSYGFDNYRLYITDLTADNIVYDETDNQIYFIDLDTIFIVDSTQSKYKSLTHKHVYLECSGCFAYSASDIASYNISDINIFAACQFLREDLYKEHSKGFLYSITPKYISSNSNLWQLLNKCVDCPDNNCLDRFAAANDLIKLFETILK